MSSIVGCICEVYTRPTMSQYGEQLASCFTSHRFCICELLSSLIFDEATVMASSKAKSPCKYSLLHNFNSGNHSQQQSLIVETARCQYHLRVEFGYLCEYQWHHLLDLCNVASHVNIRKALKLMFQNIPVIVCVNEVVG